MPSRSSRILDKVRWKISGAELMPNNSLLKQYRPNVTLHAKRGLKSLSVNREIYFTVSVRETKISRREFKISRRVHPGLNLFHS